MIYTTVIERKDVGDKMSTFRFCLKRRVTSGRQVESVPSSLLQFVTSNLLPDLSAACLQGDAYLLRGLFLGGEMASGLDGYCLSRQ